MQRPANGRNGSTTRALPGTSCAATSTRCAAKSCPSPTSGVGVFGGLAAQLRQALLFPLAFPAVDFALVTHRAQNVFNAGGEGILTRLRHFLRQAPGFADPVCRHRRPPAVEVIIPRGPPSRDGMIAGPTIQI